MSNQTNTELHEKFTDKEKESNFHKKITVSITDSTNLYGMTFEEYLEGIEIHSKCFEQMQNLAN